MRGDTLRKLMHTHFVQFKELFWCVAPVNAKLLENKCRGKQSHQPSHQQHVTKWWMHERGKVYGELDEVVGMCRRRQAMFKGIITVTITDITYN